MFVVFLGHGHCIVSFLYDYTVHLVSPDRQITRYIVILIFCNLHFGYNVIYYIESERSGGPVGDSLKRVPTEVGVFPHSHVKQTQVMAQGVSFLSLILGKETWTKHQIKIRCFYRIFITCIIEKHCIYIFNVEALNTPLVFFIKYITCLLTCLSCVLEKNMSKTFFILLFRWRRLNGKDLEKVGQIYCTKTHQRNHYLKYKHGKCLVT